MAEVIYSLQQIEDWQAQLQDFAKTPRTRFSKRQAVEAMIEDIEAALLAHPYEEVAEKLKDWGLDIAAGSLKQYVNAYRRAQAEDAGGATRKRSGKRTKKKTAAGKAATRSLESVENASPDGGVNNAVNAAADTSDNRTGNPTGRTSNRTPDGFLEMAEDL